MGVAGSAAEESGQGEIQDFVPAGWPKSDVDARLWTRDEIGGDRDALFYTLTSDALAEIAAAISFCKANALTIDTVEQEDFRLPALARDIPELRRRLDQGRGLLVLRGIDADAWSEPEFEIIGWALCNYFGQLLRQGIDRDRRLFTVADKGSSNTDPTRIGASARRSPKHSDNGCLEPRPPCYLGLFCYRAAPAGGDNTAITARTVFDTISRERPDLLPLYFAPYHFRAPQAHVWPSRGPTIVKPILEVVRGEMQIHYARVMIEPGMEMAGTPLTDRQREALDYLDEVLERPELNFEYLLRPGELLLVNNLALLHGREAFPAGEAGQRNLKRYWMWRRHVAPGVDPALLDMEELA